ncbi:LysR family transcriptional regulator [Caloramator sp. E03]|uniref:LysR family transcriptional regulator n=1 Tax=Caloramator sp. E03 TaxID=2576307 RepID=UPI0011102411|nr:LysR family transcriptional regulator [Caloramator sp. E03]QCX34129.1 LysR family transcriptional regulator [Caloramator sp. E03]
MNLKHLEYFKVLAQLEHYTLAAEKLSITQPTLTYAISELEKELGTYLFEKNGRNVRLTKYGKIFLKHVENALSELEKGEKKVKELVSPYSGTIDMAFIYTLGSFFIPNLVKNFLNKEKNKNIKFNFSQGTTKNIVKGLKEERFDLAFCSFVEGENDIDFIPILKQELVLIVPKFHSLSKFDSIDLKDTASFPFVYYNSESGIRPVIDNLFKEVNIIPKIACEVEEDSAVVGLVSINYGIAVVPKIWILDHFNIKIIPIKNPQYTRYIYLAYVKNKYISPSANLFKDFVINNCKLNS